MRQRSAPAQQTTAPAADSAAADTAAAAPEIKFTISTDAANRTQYCELFVKNLEEASNGRIKGEVLAANSLGSCNDMCQMLQLGTLDIMLSDDMSVDSNLNGALGFAWLPGLVADYDEADQYYNFGWIAEKVGEIMLENNLVRMSSFCNGFRQVGNVVRPITEMSDLAGLKIRTPSVSSIVDFYEMCGALPVMIAGSEELVSAGVLPADYDFEAHKQLVPMQPGDVPITYADTAPLERDFGFRPDTPLREGLRRFARWYKEYYKV